MALDPLEKDRLRKKMALRMQSFTDPKTPVSCVSGHVYFEPHPCELCQATHAEEILVIKNRANKKMIAAVSCLKEMVRFQVVEVEELERWLLKLKDLWAEAEKRRDEEKAVREEERKRLEKKVIVRKKAPEGAVT